MKKTLTFLFLALTTALYAQVDLAVVSIDLPTYIKDGETNTVFPLQFTCKNNDTKAINAGDTIIFNFYAIDIAASKIVIAPSALLLILNSEIAPQANFSSPTLNVTTPTIMGKNTDMRLGIAAYVFNRTAPPVDADSTDNIFFRDMTWEKNYGASVASIASNQDITVYPNPSVNEMNVQVFAAQANAVSIELMDLTGKAVVRNDEVNTITPNSYNLNTEGLENGVYILKVTNGDQVSTTKVTVSH